MKHSKYLICWSIISLSLVVSGCGKKVSESTNKSNDGVVNKSDSTAQFNRILCHEAPSKQKVIIVIDNTKGSIRFEDRESQEFFKVGKLPSPPNGVVKDVVILEDSGNEAVLLSYFDPDKGTMKAGDVLFEVVSKSNGNDRIRGGVCYETGVSLSEILK